MINYRNETNLSAELHLVRIDYQIIHHIWKTPKQSTRGAGLRVYDGVFFEPLTYKVNLGQQKLYFILYYNCQWTNKGKMNYTTHFLRLNNPCLPKKLTPNRRQGFCGIFKTCCKN